MSRRPWMLLTECMIAPFALNYFQIGININYHLIFMIVGTNVHLRKTFSAPDRVIPIGRVFQTISVHNRRYR
jgi:hypothetical protein